MLGIYRHRNCWWLSVARTLPRNTLEVLSFGYLTVCRYRLPWKLSLASLGTCLVIIGTLGHFDCNWIERASVTRRKKC